MDILSMAMSCGLTWFFLSNPTGQGIAENNKMLIVGVILLPPIVAGFIAGSM